MPKLTFATEELLRDSRAALEVADAVVRVGVPPVVVGRALELLGRGGGGGR